MKNFHKLLWFGCLILLLGCVPSLHSFYNDKDLIFEPQLVGVWVDSENKNQTWDFQKSNDTSYNVTYTEDSVPGDFSCHLFKIGKLTYLDIYPKEMPQDIADKMNGFYKLHLIPVHTLAWLSLDGDTLQMRFMDPDILKKMNENHALTVKHEQDKDENIILTASTLELQSFVKKHSKEIFAKPGVLVRKK